MPPIRLALADVGDVDLHHGDANGSDTVGKGDGGMGIPSGIHHHTVVNAVSLLKLVNQETLVVRLVVIKLDFREFSL